MGRRYSHLTIEDRCDLAQCYIAGTSIRPIAAALDRPQFTIARELRRNASRPQGYQPRYADQQAHARRWRGPRLDRDPTPRTQVLPASSRAGRPNRSPDAWRQTVTVDNGTEFARHHQLDAHGIQTCFYDPTPPGRMAASRTPSAGSAAPCPAKPTWRPEHPPALPNSSWPTTTRRANASATRPRPRSCGITCCT